MSSVSTEKKDCRIYICRHCRQDSGFQRSTRTQISPVTWTVCKCALARTHNTPTQLKMHLRWKVTGPVHCLGNGRLFCWREQLCSVMMLSEKRVSSGQTPVRSTVYTPKCICRDGDQCCVCRRCKRFHFFILKKLHRILFAQWKESGCTILAHTKKK